MARASGTRQQRRWLPALAVPILVGCGRQTPEPSPEAPSATPASVPPLATEEPSVGPETPVQSQAPPGPPSIEAGGLAEVVTTELVMRSLPGVTDESEILVRMLQPGDELFVIDGPVHATFYDWYHVQPIEGGEWPAAGWVASESREGEPWIGPSLCPVDEPLDGEAVADIHPLEALACFGDDPIHLHARFAGICAGHLPGRPNWTIEPTWLGLEHGCQWDVPTGSLTTFQPYFVPEIGIGSPPGAERGDTYWLTGQFDHPDAPACRLRELDGDPNMPPPPQLDEDQVVLLCRSRFAVTDAEPSGPPGG
jgi:hypothetical protein